MRRHLVCLIVAFTFVALLTAPAGATDRRFVESFNTKQYCDKVNTTALWDTVAGELKLPPLELSITGSYNTAGNARGGICIEGDYAYVGDNLAGLQVINITNLASPTLAATYNTPGNAHGLFVDGNYAYVADAAFGITVVNVTTPTAPVLAGSYDTPGSAQDVVVDGNYAYVADYSSGLIVLNVTNPAAPTLAGSYDTPGNARGVAIAGNYAYVADGPSGLQVINITNPASPTLAGSYDTPGTAYDVALAGDRAYIADYDGDLQVVDITNPASPAFVASMSFTGNAYGVTVHGDYAYVAGYGAGLLEVSILNPSAPVLTRSIYTSGSAYDVEFEGNHAFVADDLWGLQIVKVSVQTTPRVEGVCNTPDNAYDVAIAGDYAYVADRSSGLQVIDISVPGTPTLAGSYATPDLCFGVAVAGDYAFVTASASGVIVLNISDPTHPTLLGSYNTPGSARGIEVSGDYAFVADGAAGLVILNISNPASPTLAGTCDTPFSAYGVAVAGDYAFVADWDLGVQVVNISNPASPTLAGSYNTPGEAAAIAVAGDYAYVADWNMGLQVLNISTPSAPTLAGSLDTPGYPNGVAVSGDYAYLAVAGYGLQVINITNPASPTLAWELPLPSDAHDLALHGDCAFVAEQNSGLREVRISQRQFDTAAQKGQSLVVNSLHEQVLRTRLSTAQVDSILWEISANGGVNWQALLPNSTWSAISNPGVDVLWRSTHLFRYPDNPICSQLELEWLYQFAEVDSIRDIPGDQGGQVRVYFTRSGYDFNGEATHPIATYYIWRRMDDPAALQAALSETDASSHGTYGGEMAHGVADAAVPRELPLLEWHGRYILLGDRLPLALDFPAGAWEIVGSAPGAQREQYINVVPTLADSTVEGMAYAVYLVTAHTTAPSVWYVSPPDSGYSVDNLAPHVPTGFAVAYNSSGGNDLSWHTCPDYDFEYFKVYRGETEDFEPGPGNLVQTTIDEAWLDTVEEGWRYRYKIAAVDHAGNESAPASPGTVTGAEPPGMPKAFALYQNVPNPFNPSTKIRYDVPAGGGAVTLRIYDVGGRLVRTLVDGPQTAGQKRVTWDGTDDRGRGVASGVYFYRLQAPGYTKTLKTILLQ